MHTGVYALCSKTDSGTRERGLRLGKKRRDVRQSPSAVTKRIYMRRRMPWTHSIAIAFRLPKAAKLGIR